MLSNWRSVVILVTAKEARALLRPSNMGSHFPGISNLCTIVQTKVLIDWEIVKETAIIYSLIILNVIPIPGIALIINCKGYDMMEPICR